MRLNDSDKLSLAAIVLMLPMVAVFAALTYLEASKHTYQAAGGHEPTPQAECYEMPGQGELASFPSERFTYCNR